MSVKLKAIETLYKGYRFRSRLEARWAVFFDTLGVKWEYETEGFDLGRAGWYLPDFRIATWNYWIEIKPDRPSPEDETKVNAFGKNQNLLLICGSPWIGEHSIEIAPLFQQDSDDDDWDGTVYGEFAECRRCDGICLLADCEVHASGDHGWANLANHSCRSHDSSPCSGSLIRAYQAARSARFEHGETPR